MEKLRWKIHFRVSQQAPFEIYRPPARHHQYSRRARRPIPSNLSWPQQLLSERTWDRDHLSERAWIKWIRKNIPNAGQWSQPGGFVQGHRIASRCDKNTR